jgi:hypothetical protein
MLLAACPVIYFDSHSPENRMHLSRRSGMTRVQFEIAAALALASAIGANVTHADTPKPPPFYSYLSTQPGCRADAATDQELTINGPGQQWIIVAPLRVGTRESQRERDAEFLDINIAEPLEASLRKRVADALDESPADSGQPNVTRLKIVAVSHDVVDRRIGKARAQVRLDFYICNNGDASDSGRARTITGDGPDITSLWHRPGGEELRRGFQQAADKASDALAEFAASSVIRR